MSEPSELSIRSHRHTYTVHFGVDHLEALRQQASENAVLIIDQNVYERYEGLRRFAEERPKIILRPTEDAKSFAAVSDILGRLLELRITKAHRLVAIGGGVIQDVTAFSASLLMRGIDWTFFPTNLLSQCDSCIGSKSSINFAAWKNQLGTFFPPKAIFIDFAFLKTLPEADLRSGLGEMMHYALVSSEADFGLFGGHLEAALESPQTLEILIRRSLEIKRAMVEIDEFDTGPRNVFNYGHSFGHALETATAYGVPHGIAVSWGMDLANVLSADLGWMPMAERNRIRPTLAKVWGQTLRPELDIDAFFASLARDKKNLGKQVMVILTRGPGQMFKTPLVIDDAVRQRITHYFKDRLDRRDL